MIVTKRVLLDLPYKYIYIKLAWNLSHLYWGLKSDTMWFHVFHATWWWEFEIPIGSLYAL